MSNRKFIMMTSRSASGIDEGTCHYYYKERIDGRECIVIEQKNQGKVVDTAIIPKWAFVSLKREMVAGINRLL
jgi:hypothetical protein